MLPVLLPPEPLDKVIVSTAEKVKARIAAHAKGVAYQEPARHTDWYRVLAAAAATFGAMAIVLAAVSAVAREPRRFAVVAAALGVGALLFQLSVAVATALIVCLLILVVLSALGVPMALVLGKLLLAGLLGMIAIGVGLRFVRARKPTATDQ